MIYHTVLTLKIEQFLPKITDAKNSQGYDNTQVVGSLVILIYEVLKAVYLLKQIEPKRDTTLARLGTKQRANQILSKPV